MELWQVRLFILFNVDYLVLMNHKNLTNYAHKESLTVIFIWNVTVAVAFFFHSMALHSCACFAALHFFPLFPSDTGDDGEYE